VCDGMKLDLTRFRRPVEYVDRMLASADLAPVNDGAYQVVAPVELAFNVHKDKRRFRLEGTVRAALELTCSRCLEPFRVDVNARFDLRYLPQSDEVAGGDQEVQDDNVDTSYYRDDEISLNELLQEQMYLGLPMKPLCGEACRGLCSQCGTNLNEGKCKCAATWEDPRLAPLRELRKITDA
jgi:uncharacterized protein